MLEFLILLAIILVIGFILAMFTSIFIAYITQANYIDPLDGDEEND